MRLTTLLIMPKVFRKSTHEAKILSKIESSQRFLRKQALKSISVHIDSLSNSVAMKLIEDEIIETSSKDSLEEQIKKCPALRGAGQTYT